MDTRSLLTQRQFVTGAGTETYLAFQQQFPLREFCAFEIFEHGDALAELEAKYLYPLMSTIDDNGHAVLLDALVWRAHPDFIAALGYPPEDIGRLNELAVNRTRHAIDAWRQRQGRDAEQFPVLVAADIGPRGDGYKVDGDAASVEAALSYHQRQLAALANTQVDVVCALMMTSANEAIGIVKAASQLELPIIVSPTVETDGRLPDGCALADFIHQVDEATDALPIYYMVNCAHPTHLEPTLAAAKASEQDWLARFKGFRANSSKSSHEELDNSAELDRGNPDELGAAIAAMVHDHELCLVGGCCGTDVDHISAIAKATARPG